LKKLHRDTGEIALATKGLTRSGDAYCLSCLQPVDRNDTKCLSCASELTEEVKAFLCPKCQTVVALGEPQCSKCGLKFKVKALKPRETAEDDKFLMKLIEWGKPPEDEKSEGEPTTKPSEESTAEPKPTAPSEEQILKFAKLRDSIRDLMVNRSQMLERMETRIAEEKARLNQMPPLEGKSSNAEQVEAEIMSLANEMADITMLQAHMESLSDEISALMDSVEISEAAKARGLAARALRKKLEAKEQELEELRAREEQLVKREEMVDRKIQAYAHKKKQLDEQEEDLKLKLMKLEAERAELERLKALAAGAMTEAERAQAKEQWMDEERRFKERLLNLHSSVVTHRTGQQTSTDNEPAEVSLDRMIASLENQIGNLILEKVELQKKTSEAMMFDEDLKKLLKVLDQMLGQLPEDIIERFSKSEDFALYERFLDRFKV
jgi:DNA repair exonuclease SbcCD ATPase subunit